MTKYYELQISSVYCVPNIVEIGQRLLQPQ